MADKKISQLPKINALSGSLGGEIIIPLVHDGTTQKMDVSALAAYASQWSAKTGSANTFTGNQTVNGNLTLSGNAVIGGNVEVGGMITAQQYNVTYVSSSVQYQSGSTEFGDSADDTHTFTGTLILNGLAIGTAQLMAQTASQDSVNLRISSTTGSINTTTSSFNSVFSSIGQQTASQDLVNLTISNRTGSLIGITNGLMGFTSSLNSLTGSYATTGSNTFIGNQNITGSLSISHGEFNVTTGSLAVTSSLRFDHTQTNGATLQLSHDNNTANADHTFNVNVWSAGVYTEFVRNGTPYSILNVEAFDDNKIYLYRDTRLYNKSLVIDNNLTVQRDVVIGTGSLDINNGEFSITSGSGELTSSLSFTHTTVDPITGNATLELRYRNNDVGPENNAWRFVADDGGVKLSYDQYATSNKLLFSVSSLGSNFDKLLIWRNARLYGTGLTVDDSLLVKGVITGSLLSTNGVVSSSNQLFELNAFTASVIGQTNTISTFTSSVNFTTQSLNTQTGSQDLVNRGISSVTGSINTTTSSFNSVFSQIGSTTSSLIGITNGLMAFTAALDNTYATDAQLYQLYQATASIHSTTASLNIQTGSQDLVNRGISSVTGAINLTTSSLIGITNGLMAFTAALDSTYATDSQLYQLYQATASIHFATQSLNTQTGSIGSVLSGLSNVTSAYATTFNSIDAHILKQSIQTGSQDLVNLGISTFTGSLRSEVNLIEAYTASLKNAFTIDSNNDVYFSGKITTQEVHTTYTTSSVLFQSGSTKFGNSSDDIHEFTGSKFEVFNSDTSGTMYAVVKNNRARNAAVKTTTTNGSFIAGTSIGTDTFQYQIYDEVEGVNRVTINSQGGTTLQGAVSASQTLRVTGKTQIGTSTVDTSLGANTKLSVVGDGSVNAGASQGSLFVAAGNEGGDTGLPINMGTAGATLLLLASINTSTGTATNSATYIVRFYFDGNNAPTTTYLGGSSDFVTFGVTPSNTLAVSGSSSGNKSYAWFINKFGA
jgi:hypothetical protein